MFNGYETVERCTLCASSTHAPIRLRPHLRRCKDCGHVFLAPRPTQAAIAESYDFDDGTHAVWESQREGRDIMWQKRVERVTNMKHGGRALDVGTGFGDFPRRLRDKGGWNVEGTEVSAEAVNHAREQHGLTVHHGQIEDCDLPTRAFDLVTLWHVLEHLPQPGASLDRITQLLAPNGLVVIAVPNDGLWPQMAVLLAKDVVKRGAKLAGRRYESSVDREFGAPRLGEEIHLSFFHPRRLASALEARGLSVVERGVDDLSAQPSPATDRAYRAHVASNRLVGTHVGPAAFVAAASPA